MTTGTPPVRNRVFISYSRDDRRWVERVRLHLRPLERDPGLGVDVWDDSEIEAGADWLNEITNAIASTRAVVLLVSAAFLASDFIESNELPRLLDAADKEGVRILPVHVKPSRFLKTAGLSHFQSVNDPAHPLIGLTEAEQERVLVKLADAVEHAFTQQPPATRETPPPTRQTADALKQLPHVKSILEELRQQLRFKLGGDDTLFEPAALIAESVLLDGLRAVARRAHPKQLARALRQSFEVAYDHVRAAARQLETERQRSQVISYAAADPDLALLVLNALRDRAGVPVRVEAGRQAANEWELVKGLKLPHGFIGPDFIPAEGPREVVLEDVFIYQADDFISGEEVIAPAIRQLFYENQSGTTPRRSLLIIAPDLRGGALRMVLNEKNAGRNITASRRPFPGTHLCLQLCDLIFTTVANVDRVIVNEYETYIIVGDRAAPFLLNAQLNMLRKQLAETTDARKRDEIMARLNGLEHGGVSIISVGGKTEEERRRRAERGRRAVRHYEAAAVSGVVAGEHLALANAGAAVCAREPSGEQKQADVMLSHALDVPLRRMAEGWGRDGAETLQAVHARQLETGNNWVGYYGEEDAFVDLFEAGAVVPAEYVCILMQEAVEAAAGRIASLRFTDEVVREAAALEGQ